MLVINKTNAKIETLFVIKSIPAMFSLYTFNGIAGIDNDTPAREELPIDA